MAQKDNTNRNGVEKITHSFPITHIPPTAIEEEKQADLIKSPQAEGLLQKVHHFIQQHRLFSSGQRVIIAVSGGADSTALLLLLSTLCHRHWVDVQLAVACVDHGLRPESATETAWVGQLAHQLGLDFFTTRFDLSTSHIGIEERARSCRYEFFSQIALQWNAQCVAVAHTADDQTETVLLHLFQASGLAGLAGMPVQRPLSANSKVILVRPLLCVHKAELIACLQSEKQIWWEDCSNQDPHFTRNRLRLQVIPFLKQHFPQLDSCISTIAHHSQSTISYLESQAQLYANQYVAHDPSSFSGFNRLWHVRFQNSQIRTPSEQFSICRIFAPALSSIPAALRPWLLRCLVQQLGQIPSLRYSHYQAWECLWEATQGNAHLPDRLQIWRTPRFLDVLLTMPIYTPLRTENRVIEFSNLPGVYLLEEKIELHVAKYLPNQWNVDELCHDQEHLQARMSLDAIAFPCLMRTCQPTDNIQLLGSPGTRKVLHILRDIGIPSPWRELIWVVEDSQKKLIWIPGIGIAHHVRLISTSQVAVELVCRI